MAWNDTKASMGNVKEVSSHPSSESVETPPPPRSRVKSHLRKWWPAYLIFFIASVLIIVLCLVYVAFPRIAQRDINRSTLTITALAVTNPGPNSFHLLQNGTVGNPSAYHPRLDAFNATLALEGSSPFASVEIPAIHSTEKALSIVDQDVHITDLDAFSAYTAAALSQEELKVKVTGRTGLHEMRFPTAHVDYRKTATLKGLNKLTGFAVTSFDILLTPDPADGANMVGTVSIPNPSVMTLTMGNVTFANFLPATSGTAATPIGNTTLPSLVLRPGDNTVAMRSIINQTAVIGALTTVYKTGFVPIDITGVSAVYDGQHLPYYETALRGLTQHVSLDVGTALKKIGLDVTALAKSGGATTTPP